MSNQPTENQIEAILFYRGGSVHIKEIATALSLSEEETATYIDSLKTSLEGRGVRVVRDGNTVALATSPESSELIEKLRREELEGPLGKAGLETLAIILFRGPISRADIEYVRGVNCTSILRALLIRGLVERVEHPTDKRSFMYTSTVDLPAYFGVESVSDLPNYADVRARIESIFTERDELAKKETAVEVPAETHE